MDKKSDVHIKERSEMVKKIVKHFFGVTPKKIEYKTAGMTNSVFEIMLAEGEYIVRIGEEQSKLQDYIKEQWVTQRAKEVGVPITDIMEVGCELISEPYMLQKKVSGRQHYIIRTNLKC